MFCGTIPPMRAVFFAVLVLLAAGALLYVWYVFGIAHIEPQAPPIVTNEGERNGVAIETWQQKAPMATRRTEVAAAAVDGKAYVVGGLNGFAQTLDTEEVYDPETDAWTQATPLPVPLHHAMAAVFGGDLYVFGGFTNITFTPTSAAWKLDIKEGEWHTLGLLPEARAAGVAVVHGGFIYIVGGVTFQGITAGAVRYDSAQQKFEAIQPMTDAREHLAGAVAGDKIFVVGGRRGGLSGNRATLEIYDTVKQEWTIGPNMPTARGGIAAAVYNGKLHVFGGEKTTGTFAQHEVFDPQRNRWEEALAMPTARHGLAAVTLGDGIFAIGGGKRPGLSVSAANEQYRVLMP